MLLVSKYALSPAVTAAIIATLACLLPASPVIVVSGVSGCAKKLLRFALLISRTFSTLRKCQTLIALITLGLAQLINYLRQHQN